MKEKFRFSERDLDLVQLEELHAANGYAAWFGRRAGLQDPDFLDAVHSVSGFAEGRSGETDLLAFYREGGTRIAVMIEDKVSAAFTHRQAERYVERGQALVAQGEADRFRTVLVAPAQYLHFVPQSDPWDVRIPIEEIAEWFEGQEGSHASWRASALRACLGRIAHSGTASSEDAAKFSLALSEYIARIHAPNLSHKPGKDTNGPVLKFSGSNAKKTLWWKVRTSQMVLQLMDEYQGLAERIGLPPDVDLEKAADHGRKCDYLVTPTPVVDFAEPFEDQLIEVEEAMQAALLITSVVPRLEVMLETDEN